MRSLFLSDPRRFFFLLSLSMVIAVMGLSLDSPAVVIGAMLIAPLMTPGVGVPDRCALLRAQAAVSSYLIPRVARRVGCSLYRFVDMARCCGLRCRGFRLVPAQTPWFRGRNGPGSWPGVASPLR